MKKRLILLLAALITFAAPAFAQTEEPPMEEEAQPAEQPDPALVQAKFMIAKARLLEHLRLTVACVDSSTTPEMIRACMEPRGVESKGAETKAATP